MLLEHGGLALILSQRDTLPFHMLPLSLPSNGSDGANVAAVQLLLSKPQLRPEVLLEDLNSSLNSLEPGRIFFCFCLLGGHGQRDGFVVWHFC